MQLNEHNLLYISRTMGIGGVEKIVFDLCEIMKDRFQKVIVCSSGGFYVKQLEELGIKHYVIPDLDRKNCMDIIKTIRILSSVLKKEKISVVHTHHRMGAFYSRFLRYFHQFISVYTAHSIWTDKKLLTAFILQKTEIVAVGNKVRENLIDVIHVPAVKIKTIFNCVKPLEENRDDVNIGEKEECIYVADIGRLSKEKGHVDFISALRYVKNEKIPFKAYIAGTGLEEDDIRRKIKELDLEEDVILLGYRDDVQKLLAQMDVLVLASLKEGLPLTVLEAFSVGRPVIATAVGGSIEIIEDGWNGYLVETHAPMQIAKKIIYLAQNKRVLNKLGENALKKFKDKYSYSKFVNEYLRYYRGLEG